MAATVQSLRDILFNVKSPIDLINRSTETTIMNQACQEIYNHLSKENVNQFFQLFLESMVIRNNNSEYCHKLNHTTFQSLTPT
jgi:hypothetical protein